MNPRSHEPDDDESLLKRAREGDRAAVDLLLSLYRDRLRKMVAMRIDPAIHPRVDASDVVQETLIEANRRMGEFLERSLAEGDRSQQQEVAEPAETPSAAGTPHSGKLPDRVSP